MSYGEIEISGIESDLMKMVASPRTTEELLTLADTHYRGRVNADDLGEGGHAFTVTGRPGWDQYFLGIAVAVSRRGECTRSQVGAVLVKDKRIRSTGYNGAPAGAPSCLDGACPRATSNAVPGVSSYEDPATFCIAIHAEANALLFASKDDCDGAMLYITRAPCHGCERLIRGSGVAQVVYPHPPHDGPCPPSSCWCRHSPTILDLRA